MNYTQFFAKGGEIDTETIKSEMRRIFKISDQNKVEAIWQNAVQKYGSEEDVIIALYNTIGEDGSDESVQNAMMQIFNYTPMEESQYFKCGGKLQQLVTKFGKGGGVDCGCGGTKLQEGGRTISADGSITIVNPNTAQADTLGRYSYPSTNGKFQLLSNGERNATVWDNTGGFPIARYANETFMQNHPVRTFLGGYKKAPAGYFENIVDRVNNRFDQNGVPTKQDGGLVLEQLPGHDVDTRLTRRQARDLAALNQGYSGEQFQYAMDNAMNALRNQGLRGRELRERAREMAAGINPTERSIASAPTALNTTSTIASPAEITVPEQLILPETQRMLDTMLDRTNTTLTKNLNRSKVTVKPSDEYIRKGNNPILSYQDFNRQPGYTRRSDGQPLSYQDFTQQLGDVYVTANKSGYNKKGNEPVSSYNNFIEQLPEAQVFGSNLPEVYVTANRSGYNSLPNGQSAVSYRGFRQQLPDVTVTPTENGILLPGITKYGYRNVQTPVPVFRKQGGQIEKDTTKSLKCGGKTRKKK